MLPVKDSPIYRDGTMLVLAYDHGLEHGPSDFQNVPGTEDPERVFEAATHDAVTALAVGKGLAEAYYPSYEDDVTLMAKCNGNSNLSVGEPYSPPTWSVDYAAEVGAEAVGYTLYAGSNHEDKMVKEFRKVQEDARDHDMPVVMWAYPRGQPIKDTGSEEVISYAGRIGLELGADVVKCKYTGTPESMETVVRMSHPTDVILSGGSKTSDQEFLESVEAAMGVGCKGLAVGRNVFQREDPTDILDKLEGVVHEGESADAALAD